jgi:hypothetical protein
MAAFMPGASPPEVKTANVFTSAKMRLFCARNQR